MGIVLDVPEAGVDYVLYGDKSNIVANYVQKQMQEIPHAFNEFSERIQTSLSNSYNYLTDKLTKTGILQRIQNQGVQIENNYYEFLNSFEKLQSANTVMQRWVMAHPTVKRYYIGQNLDGYSDTYIDISNGEIGESDYNYRRVMDGVVIDDEDRLVYKHYIDDLLEGDRELEHYEKDVILNTWNCIDWILDNCDFDFTNNSEEPTKINK
jgi:hypothetical protein